MRQRQTRAAAKPLGLTGRRLEGYAAIWGLAYDLGDGTIERAMPNSMKPLDVELTLGHSGPVLASERGGTLQVELDSRGLKVTAPELDTDDPDVQRILPKMRRGDVTGLSVGMYFDDFVQADDGVWEIRDAEVFEAAIVARPAQPAAQAKLREITTLADATVRRAPPGLYFQRGPLTFISTRALDRMATWNAGVEVRSARTETALRRMHAWIDPSADPIVKSAYHFPHHRANGEVVWQGVVEAMATLLAGGGIPESDQNAVWEHLARHYEQYGEVAPKIERR